MMPSVDSISVFQHHNIGCLNFQKQNKKNLKSNLVFRNILLTILINLCLCLEVPLNYQPDINIQLTGDWHICSDCFWSFHLGLTHYSAHTQLLDRRFLKKFVLCLYPDCFSSTLGDNSYLRCGSNIHKSRLLKIFKASLDDLFLITEDNLIFFTLKN